MAFRKKGRQEGKKEHDFGGSPKEFSPRADSQELSRDPAVAAARRARLPAPKSLLFDMCRLYFGVKKRRGSWREVGGGRVGGKLGGSK